MCVCVCVLGIGGKDSPRVWETCANLTAYGCLVVRSVCVIIVDTLLTTSFLLGPYSTLRASVQQYTAKQVVREKWNACVYFAYKLKSRTQMPSLESWRWWVKYVCMALQLTKCHRLLCKIYHFENCIHNHLPRALWGKAILWFYKAQWGIWGG